MRRISTMRRMLYFIFLVKAVLSDEGEEECPHEPTVSQLDHHPLINLGNSLKHRLTDLTCPHSVLLYKDFQNYYNKLSDIYRLLKQRDAVGIVKGFKVYDAILKAGGPPHLNVTIDYYKLKNAYKWEDSGEIKDVKEVMLLTKELWEDIQDRAAHLRSGEPEPTPDETSTIDWTPFLRELSSGSEGDHL